MTVRHDAQVFELELSLVRRLCESIGSARALTVWLLLKDKQYEELADLEIDPSDYGDHRRFADDYLVTKILSKNPRLPVSVDPDAVARRKFWEAETKCAETNNRLTGPVESLDFPNSDVRAVVLYARQYVERILGPLTRDKLRYAEQNMRFGPGATTSLSGVVTQGKKYSRRTLDATPRVLPFRTFGFPDIWKDAARDIRLRRSSKMRVVPKKATCGRTICIEPDLNIFVQLGQGALIRKQLAEFGLDLNTQEVNQEMARKASIGDHLCTMDLSSASDLISREAVWQLLPYAWADFLHFSRVDFVESEGDEVELHKWSSMGNGYTFELETLLFYSILLGACEHYEWGWDEVIAYGDDLIFPSQFERLIRETLEFLGFSVNARKTFGEGAFRESCGTDWFRGHNVRPIFLKGQTYDFPSTCYIYANSIRRWARRRNGGSSSDSRCFPVWLRCVTAVEPNLRFRIPEGYGDVGFVSNWDEATPASRLNGRRHGWSGFTFRYRAVKSVERIISPEGAYYAFLNGNTTDFTFGMESLRGRYGKAVTKSGYSLEWPNLGPWL